MEKKKIVAVSGGTGLLGSHLLYKLVKEDNDISALSRSAEAVSKVQDVFSYYSKEDTRLLERINWLIGDITDYSAVMKLTETADHVYHCAGQVSFDPREKYRLLKTNVLGTRNVIDACITNDVKKLLHVSSVSAIGTSSEINGMSAEQFWPQGKKSQYAYSKLKSEFEVWRGIEEGLNAVIVNPSVILGPGFWDNGSSRIFKTVAKGLKYYPSGGTGYVGVWDCVSIMMSLMHSDIQNERFILNAANYSYYELFRMIAAELNISPPSVRATKVMTEVAWRLLKVKGLFNAKEPKLTRETARISHDTKYYSSQKVADKLGFTFTPINQVVKEICRIYQNGKNIG